MVEPTQAKVLIVEDNPDNLFLTISLLRTEVKVSYVNGRASSQQFFRLLQSQPDLVPDLILLDIQVPHEDGFSILRKIRQHPTVRDVCVVALTANTSPEHVQMARDAGFNGFIGKPIKFRVFPEQIRRILGGEAVWEPESL